MKFTDNRVGQNASRLHPAVLQVALVAVLTLLSSVMVAAAFAHSKTGWVFPWQEKALPLCQYLDNPPPAFQENDYCSWRLFHDYCKDQPGPSTVMTYVDGEWVCRPTA